MNIKSRFLKAFVSYTLIPALLFLIFKKTLDKGVLKYLVDSVFSACYPSNLLYDIVLTILMVVSVIPIFQKVFKNGRIPNKLFFIAITSLVIYSTYRFSNTFQFTGATFYEHLMLADIIFLYPVAIIVAFIFQYFVGNHSKLEPNIDAGFTIDEPFTINGNNDLLNRSKFIDVIADKIRNTKTEKSSFAIGIVAKWGYGKTTFINTLLGKFKDEEAIKIELNVWKCNNNTQIIETFFRELRKALKPYSFSIDNKLEEYTLTLIKGTKNEHFNVVNNILNLFTKDVSLAGQYESINKEIKRINKRIIVVFDDLDRLDKREIYEVIRLIRNTANFSNTFFIASYDRTYILNAIQEINTYQTHYFLEKIFQLEFTLPPISSIILEDELKGRLFPILTEISRDGFEQMKERGVLNPEFGNYDLTSMFIHNLRDVVRFVNSFQLNYHFVKDEIYFPDFYSLELIRFKHPDLFSLIYNERNRIFTTDSNGKSMNPLNAKYHYSLAKVSKGKDEKNTILKEVIASNSADFKLGEKEVEIICSSLASIFSDSDRFLWDSRRKIANSHLSVIIPSMFERYFYLGIEGKLSEIQFSKIRQLPKEEFLQEISELVATDDIKMELSKRLEQIEQFDNRLDFENIVSALFYLGNLELDKGQNLRHGFVGFDGKVVAALFGREFILTNYYSNSKNDYKSFILKLLYTDTPIYNYTNRFLNLLLRDGYYSINRLFSSNEISDVLFKNFENALKKAKIFNEQIWWYFLHCNNRRETVSGDGIRVDYPKNPKAINLMKKFVWHNDLENFIDYTISKGNPFDEVYNANNEVLKSIFGSVDRFVRALRITKRTSPKIQEFIKYYNMVHDPKKNLNGVERSFFKEINLKWENN